MTRGRRSSFVPSVGSQRGLDTIAAEAHSGCASAAPRHAAPWTIPGWLEDRVAGFFESLGSLDFESDAPTSATPGSKAEPPLGIRSAVRNSSLTADLTPPPLAARQHVNAQAVTR